MNDSTAFEIAGPFTANPNAQFAAYVTRGLFRGGQHIVGMVALNQPEQLDILSKNFQVLFEYTLEFAEQNLAEWREIPCYTLILQSESEPSSHDTNLTTSHAFIRTHHTKETDLSKIAEEILSSMYLTFSKQHGTDKYVINKSEDFSHPGIYSYRIQKAGSDIGFHVTTRNGNLEDNLFDVLVDMDPELVKFDRDMYYTEVVALLQKSPLDAKDGLNLFRSYYYYILLGDQLSSNDVKEIVSLGIAVAMALMQSELFDYAEWAADSAAQHAENADLYSEALLAHRFAGIASEALGRIQNTRTHYERGLTYLDKVQDVKEQALFHMSYGISLVVLLSHCEAERVDLANRSNHLLAEILQSAEQQLKIAQELLQKLVDESIPRNLCAIELDLIRIEDLKGQHESALTKIEELLTSKRFIPIPRFVASAIIYRLAICKKLMEQDQHWKSTYHTALNDAALAFDKLTAIPKDRFCLFNSLMGEELLDVGQVEDAIQAFQQAYNIQMEYAKGVVRPPQPEALYGGLLAIDVTGKLQQALLTQAEKQTTTAAPHPILQAFLLADDAKVRYFKRDLAFLAFKSTTAISPLLFEKGDYLRQALAKGSLDHRILLADYNWYLNYDIPSSPEAKQLLPDDSPLTIEDVQRVLSSETKKMALLSLYATPKVTFVYLFDRLGEPPKHFRLDISLEQLNNIVLGLQTGIRGNALYPRINPHKPEKSHKFFAPFLRLSEQFAPVLPYLQNIDLVLVSPHSIWHNLPLHALLLPPLWEKGLSSGLQYIPGIRLYELLEKREVADGPSRSKHRGLTTAYEASNPVDKFAQAHQEFESIFRQLDGTLYASFGPQATDKQFFNDTGYVGMHHILAHGQYQQDHNPLDASLLVSDTEGVPLLNQQGEVVHGALVTASALMLNRTAAGHVTVQACSLGRSQGDEFWGVSRALIAAGANSVIAPLWDIDLESSTQLLRLFYTYWLIDKLPKWKAWAEAQRVFYSGKSRPEWQHFYHWAAFRLLGL